MPDASAVLIVVDVQNSFMPGGSLAVPRGDEVVPVINALAKRFANVVLTQDWHPPGHRSFASSHPGRKPFDMITFDYGEQMHVAPSTRRARLRQRGKRWSGPGSSAFSPTTSRERQLRRVIV